MRLPDISRPHRYQHTRPRRPSHLARRLRPPPDRPGPPDLTLFLYVGIVLALIMVIIAIPYLIGYLAEVLFG